MSTLGTYFEVYTRNKDYLQCGSYFILRDTVADLITAENALRELTQREETLKHKTTALEKLTAADAHKSQLEEARKQLQDTQLQYPRQEYALWKATSSLPGGFREAYYALRRNPTWFMREEMCQGCLEQGGCCSRNCGCCAQRHLSKRPKGQGHCTPECLCCIEFRGFELSHEEKEERHGDLAQRLKRPLGDIYIRRLAVSLFLCPQKAPPVQNPEKPKPWWRWIPGLGFADGKA